MKGHKGHHHRGSPNAPKASKTPKNMNNLTPPSNVDDEAKETASGFRKGGTVGGKKGHSRLDRKPRKRGGRCMSGGGSVYSAAASASPAKKGGSDA